ncbi:MAG: bifunctional phosphoglucose/phosphomannose isomerase [Flavobacteriales bacterium]|nr:bifunctional phosphoglucose/phosphomannose isomerase [Flavobacteriales bacterium]
MRDLVADFTKHLAKAIEIGARTSFRNTDRKIENVLISGLGGSGIGGTIVSQLVAQEIKIPVIVNKDYSIPEFVNENTLFIVSSYSGNTEETLYALEAAEKKGAEIVCVTSGGKVESRAIEKGYNHIIIPGGLPPRAAFGLGFPQLLYVLNQYGLITNDFEEGIKDVIKSINSNDSEIKQQAKYIASSLKDTIPAIYTEASFEGVAIRFRQQVNENAKMLCWHHVIPEMNHNELVGWAGGSDKFSVIIFRNKTDFYRSQKRIDINKEIIKKHTSNITEVFSKGYSAIEKMLYLIHFGDWISVELADLKQIDATEVDVITGLKDELSKL